MWLPQDLRCQLRPASPQGTCQPPALTAPLQLTSRSGAGTGHCSCPRTCWLRLGREGQVWGPPWPSRCCGGAATAYYEHPLPALWGLQNPCREGLQSPWTQAQAVPPPPSNLSAPGPPQPLQWLLGDGIGINSGPLSSDPGGLRADPVPHTLLGTHTSDCIMSSSFQGPARPPSGSATSL